MERSEKGLKTRIGNSGEKGPRQHRFFRAGWLIDGNAGAIRENVVFEIKGGQILKISYIVPGMPLPRKIIDLSACTLMPGLIDSHVHLFMSGSTDRTVRDKQLNADFVSVKNVIFRHLTQQLSCGVVAVRDGGDRGGHTLRYKQEDHDVARLPLDLKAAGRAWHSRGRYGRLIGHSPPDNLTLAESISDMKDPIDHVKIVNSGLNSLIRFGKRTPTQFGLGDMTLAVNAAKRKGLKVMVHANGEGAVDISLRAGCHSIEHGFFMGKDNLSRMADNGTAWVPTACTMKAYLQLAKPSDREYDGCRKNLEHQLEQLAVARGLGVNVTLGTDAGSPGVHHGQSVRMEMELLKAAGYTIQEAIQSASMNGAKLLRLEHLGCLSEGKSATFIAVKGDPSMLPESLDRIECVCVNGIFRKWPNQTG